MNLNTVKSSVNVEEDGFLDVVYILAASYHDAISAGMILLGALFFILYLFWRIPNET